MRARRSVLENLEILWRCLPRTPDGQPEPDAESASDLLERLRRSLESWEPPSLGRYSDGGNLLDS
jgi:hypothetical protein